MTAIASDNGIYSHALPCGMTLVGEPSDAFESAAFHFVVPCGRRHDPSGLAGLASLTCEMTLRGAGDRDSRGLINSLERLGVERGESVGVSHTVYTGSLVADVLTPALEIYADVLRRPTLPAGLLDAGRQVCLQELRGIDDEPSQKLMSELRQQHYPSPFGLLPQGDSDGLAAATIDDVTAMHGDRYRPEETILAVAGRFDWDALCETVDRLFGDWSAPAPRPEPEPPAVPTTTHMPYDSGQCYIGIALPSIPYRDPNYFQAWGAVGVLSGGSSSRLFTEVREKRGLCYTVSASLQSQKDRAAVMCYAGTTAERAQETLDVTVAEIRKLREGVRQEELDRLKARIKSGLIMQQEFTGSRSSALARDWRHLGFARSLNELSSIIDGVTADSINAFLSEQPEPEMTIVTLGPAPLDPPREAAAT
ncbi:MAG: pitrilysin family protein [Planctomycetota bacterium]